MMWNRLLLSKYIDTVCSHRATDCSTSRPQTILRPQQTVSKRSSSQAQSGLWPQQIVSKLSTSQAQTILRPQQTVGKRFTTATQSVFTTGLGPLPCSSQIVVDMNTLERSAGSGSCRCTGSKQFIRYLWKKSNVGYHRQDLLCTQWWHKTCHLHVFYMCFTCHCYI